MKKLWCVSRSFQNRKASPRQRRTQKRWTRLGALIALSVALLLAGLPAWAQTNNWLGLHPVNVLDVWSNAGEWSLGVVPDGSTNIRIGFDTVGGDTSFTNSNTLTINSPGTLLVFSGTTITNSNLGTITGTGTLLNFGTIQGAGSINGGLTLTNKAGGVINANDAGAGTMTVSNANATNAGLMEASGLGTLQLSGVVINNAGGTIGTFNSTLGFDDVLLNKNTYIAGGTLNGFQVFAQNRPDSFATLDGSTAAGAVTLQGTNGVFNGLALAGTINNQGHLAVVSDQGVNSTLLLLSDVTLQGGGGVFLDETNNHSSISLNGATLTNVDNLIAGTGTIMGGQLVNGPGGTILALPPNSGTDTGLVLDSSVSVTNSGLMAAESATLTILGNVNNSGGTITAQHVFAPGEVILGGVISNTGGVISAGNGGLVLLEGATIQGGLLNSAAGTIESGFGGATLSGFPSSGSVTIEGTYTVAVPTNCSGACSGQTIIQGSINNLGTIQVNGSGAQNASLTIFGNATLQGGGTVTLANSGGENAFINAAGAPIFTLTNVDNTIQGAGVIGADVPAGRSNPLPFTLVNGSAGIINANVAGQRLIVAPGCCAPGLNIVNAGLMEATGGGLLSIGSNVDNTGGGIAANGAGSQVLLEPLTEVKGGTITAQNGGAVQLQNAYIFGGTLNNVSGTMELLAGGFSGTTLDGTTNGPVTINGSLTADPGTQTLLKGTLVNTGNIQVNSGGGNNTRLSMGVGTFTLQGGGTVTLASLAGGGVSSLDEFGGGTHTWINVDNTIQGAGAIQGTGQFLALQFMNEAAGTILANTPGQTLTIDTAGFTNAGRVQVNSGSTLAVLAPFTQTGGVTDIEHGTLILGQGGNVSGGTVLGNGLIQGNLTLTGGAMQPGSGGAPGLLFVQGNYTHGQAMFEELISKTGNGLLFVNGAATLGSGSLLDISLLNGFTPVVGQTFEIMEFAGLSGVFSNAPTTGFEMDGFDWSIAYNSNSILLDFMGTAGGGGGGGGTPAPEPGSMLMLGVGLIGLVCSRFRKQSPGSWS